MKIADGLLLQKDIQEEISRLRQLAKTEAWEYRTTDPNSKWIATFDVEANHALIKKLQKQHRKISRAISITNNTAELVGIIDKEFEEFLS